MKVPWTVFPSRSTSVSPWITPIPHAATTRTTGSLKQVMAFSSSGLLHHRQLGSDLEIDETFQLVLYLHEAGRRDGIEGALEPLVILLFQVKPLLLDGQQFPDELVGYFVGHIVVVRRVLLDESDNLIADGTEVFLKI